MQQTIEGAVASTQTTDVLKTTDGKTLARIDWLRLWPKNPRIIDTKNLKKLEKQIKELGVYKPLVITPDGEILGGNQRFKCLSELVKADKKYEWVWVSVVEAWTDEERLKYALSDNFSAGEYTREKLEQIINLDQAKLFDNYDISFEEKQTIKELMDDIALSEQEMKFKSIKKNLKAMGINDETVSALEMMTSFSKIKEDLPDVDLKGVIVGQKFPLLFWVDDEILYKQLQEIYTTGYKDKYNTHKLVEITEEKYDTKLPTTNERLEEIIKKVRSIRDDIEFRKEIKENYDKQMKTRNELITEFNTLVGGQSDLLGV